MLVDFNKKVVDTASKIKRRIKTKERKDTKVMTKELENFGNYGNGLKTRAYKMKESIR